MGRKIIILTSEFPPHPGGIGNHAFHLAKHLVARGYDTVVIAPADPHLPVQAFDERQRFKIIRAPGGGLSRMLATMRAIRAERSPGMMLLATGRSSLILAGIGAVTGDLPVIAIAHGLDINSRSTLYRLLVNRGLERSKVIVAVSNYTRSKIPASFRDKALVINNGFDGPPRDRPRLQRGSLAHAPRLITVGSLSERKGQINVIRAMPALLSRFPGIKYAMVGKLQDGDRIVAEAKHLQVESAIEVKGELPFAQVVEELQRADVFIMLSNKTSDGDFEGFGIAIIEANNSGLPAIGAADCGIEDAISAHQSGALVNPHRAEDVVAALQEIILNYTSFSSQAIEHAQKFRWDRVIERYVQLIDKLPAT